MNHRLTFHILSPLDAGVFPRLNEEKITRVGAPRLLQDPELVHRSVTDLDVVLADLLTSDPILESDGRDRPIIDTGLNQITRVGIIWNRETILRLRIRDG